MLILSRKTDEKLIIGEGEDQIVICIVAIVGDKVKVGIEAPKNIGVHREEVWEAIKRERGEG